MSAPPASPSRTLGGLAKHAAEHAAGAALEAVERKIRWESKSPNDPAQQYDGHPPLYWAASVGHVPICELLLQQAASVRWQHPITGSTPILAAALGKQREALGLLLRHGADPHVRNAIGLSPLLASAMKGSPGCAHLLLLADGEARPLEPATTGTQQLGHVPLASWLRQAGVEKYEEVDETMSVWCSKM